MSILLWDDPIILTPTNPIEDITPEIVELAQRMEEVTRSERALGLAANQVGQPWSMFNFFEEGDETVTTVLNPTIWESDGRWTFKEGCLSMPGIFFDIVRPRRVRLTGLDLDGNEVDRDGDSIVARIWQHEIDHLAGVLILDRVTRQQRQDAIRRLKKWKAKQ